MAPHAGYAPTQPVRQTGRLLLHQWGPFLERLWLVSVTLRSLTAFNGSLICLSYPAVGFRSPKPEARDLAFARRPLTSII